MRSLALTDKKSFTSTKQSYVERKIHYELMAMSLKESGKSYRLDCSAARSDFEPLSAFSQYVPSSVPYELLQHQGLQLYISTYFSMRESLGIERQYSCRVTFVLPFDLQTQRPAKKFLTQPISGPGAMTQRMRCSRYKSMSGGHMVGPKSPEAAHEPVSASVLTDAAVMQVFTSHSVRPTRQLYS